MSGTNRPARPYAEENRAYWNEVTPSHVNSEFYGVEEFLNGQEILLQHELDALGDVKGKQLIHLQCHFGMDTLAWARRGAEVTGVDISDDSIHAARELAQRAKLDARFERIDILDLPGPLQGQQWDIVYTGRGALCWLSDLDRWAKIVADLLVDGGMIYLMDTHPFLYLVNEDGSAPPLIVNGGYFHEEKPLSDEPGGYTDYAGDYKPKNRSYEWMWSIADMVGSLLRAGLVIESLDELDGLFFKGFDGMERCEDGYWRFEDKTVRVPMTVALTAVKPGTDQ